MKIGPFGSLPRTRNGLLLVLLLPATLLMTGCPGYALVPPGSGAYMEQASTDPEKIARQMEEAMNMQLTDSERQELVAQLTDKTTYELLYLSQNVAALAELRQSENDNDPRVAAAKNLKTPDGMTPLQYLQQLMTTSFGSSSLG